MSRTAEKIYPFTIAILVSVLSYALLAKEYLILPADITNIFSAFINLAGIGIGFLGATKAIILALSNRPILEALKEREDNYREFIGYLMATIRNFFLFALISSVCLLLDWKWQNYKNYIWFAVWTGSLTWSVLSYVRFSKIYSIILYGGSDDK